MRIYGTGLGLLIALAATPLLTAGAGSLRGSRESMEHQYEVAREEDVAFLRTPADVREQIETQQLERVAPNADIVLANVSYPYARHEVTLFIERLAAEYRAATGHPLVVTSLTRPTSKQPSNAHPLSVHPAGLAVDLRVPADAAARAWLEAKLMSLEDRNILDVTRERHPPHYHVAVFPEEYQSYENARVAEERAAAVKRASPPVVQATASTHSAALWTSLILSAIAAAIIGVWQRRRTRELVAATTAESPV